MEHLGSEVSAKIRQAIKAKLIELNAYVDDELPDYIMVMVANRKSPEVMSEDLGLFLNDNTATFVEWLAQVLEKLKKVTLGADGKSKKKSSKKAKKLKSASEISGKKKKKSSKTSPKEKKKLKRKSSSSAKAKKEEFEAPPVETRPYDKKDKGFPASKDASDDRSRNRRPHHSRRSVSRSRSRSPLFHSSEGHGRQKGWAPPPREGHGREPLRERREEGRNEGRGDRHDRAREESPVGYDDQGNWRGSFRPRQDRRSGGDEPARRDSGVAVRGRSPPAAAAAISRHSQRSGQQLASSIGAVISHDSDGEYDPEQMLKRSLMASQIKVAPRPSKRPLEANKSLVMKAVAEADRSIVSREREDRRRDEELEAIHKKRMQLSKALKEGKLDQRKIAEINKDVGVKEVRKDRREDKREDRREDRREERREDRREERSKSTNVKVPKAEKKEEESEELGYHDLRHSLGKRHNRQAEFGRRPGITVQITNDAAIGKASAKPAANQKAEVEDEDDRMLEKMRRRALESMRKSTHVRGDSRGQVQEKKIIIPLNDADDTSDDDKDTDVENKEGEKETPDESSEDSSSSDSSTGSSSGEEDSDVSLSDVEDLQGARSNRSNKDPTFIVTLDGINKEYFRQQPKKESVETGNNVKPIAGVVTTTATATSSSSKVSKPTAPVVGQKRPPDKLAHPSPTKKPEAKVAPLRLTSSAGATASQQRVTNETSPKVALKKSAERPRPPPEGKGKLLAEKRVSPKKEVVKAEKTEGKPKRPRITAPPSDKPPSALISSSKLVSSIPRHLLDKDRAASPVNASSKAICRFWPNCTRGADCYFFHPKQSPPLPKIPDAGKFRWTSASQFP